MRLKCLSLFLLFLAVAESKELFLPSEGQVYLYSNLGRYSQPLEVLKNSLYGSNYKYVDVAKGVRICDMINNEVLDYKGLIIVLSDNDFCNIHHKMSNIQVTVHGETYQAYYRSNNGYPVTGPKIRGDPNTILNLIKSSSYDIFVEKYLNGGNIDLPNLSAPKKGYNFSMPILGWILIGAIIAGGILDKWDVGNPKKQDNSVLETIKELELLKPPEFRIKPRKIYEGLKSNPIKNEDFRHIMKLMTEYVIDYTEHPEIYDVTTNVKQGFVFDNLPHEPPVKGEKFTDIMKDIYKYIMPGMTHWQHPRFHAYFAAGRSVPDLLAELIASTISVINFSWDASPSISELEVSMVNWVAKMFGLPEKFMFKSIYADDDNQGGGAMQDSATDAILIALLSARHRHLTEHHPIELGNRDNEHKELTKLVAYASKEAHSSIEKAATIALVHLRPIKVDEKCAMRGPDFEKQVIRDIERGLKPFFVHVTLGTTATCAFDNLKEIVPIAKKYDIWIHVDAAYAGCAWVCPEYRYFTEGLEEADSLDINLHKMFLLSTSAAFLYSKHAKLIKETMNYNPAYLGDLKTKHKRPIDFRNWVLALSRRPRALKVWFLLRLYGVSGMQDYIRRLTQLTVRFKEHLEKDPRIEIFGEQKLPLVCFRLKAKSGNDADAESNELTAKLATFINNSRKLLVTPAKPRGVDVIRISLNHQYSSVTEVDENFKILSDLIEEYLALSNKTKIVARKEFANDPGIVGSPGLTTSKTMFTQSSNHALTPVSRSTTMLDLRSDASPLRRDNEELKNYPELKSERTPPKDENSNANNSTRSTSSSKKVKKRNRK